MNKTKEKILQASITLWADDISATLDDIATYIGISRRTLHRHYGCKSDLVQSVMQYLLNDYSESINNLLVDDIEPIIQLKKLFYNDVKQAENYLLFKQLSKLDSAETQVDRQKIDEIIERYRKIFSLLLEQNELNDLMTLAWLESFYSAVADATIKRLQNGDIVEDTLFIAWQTFCRGIYA